MCKSSFIKQRPFCMKLQEKVNVTRFYEERDGNKPVCYKEECEHRFDCKESTNCIHAFHPVGSEYLHG